MSGTTLRSLSNLTSPLNMFCCSSWSVSRSAMAGSSVLMSSRIGNLSVWSAARPPVLFVEPPHAPRTRVAVAPTQRVFRNRDESGVIPFPLGRKELEARASPPRLLPGFRGESAPTRGGDRSGRRLLHPTLWLGATRLSTGESGPEVPTPLPRSCHDRPVSVIGVGSRRLEGREKVMGAPRYTADLELAGLLHVQLVLSHLASARIRGIDTAAARSAPG